MNKEAFHKVLNPQYGGSVVATEKIYKSSSSYAISLHRMWYDILQ